MRTAGWLAGHYIVSCPLWFVCPVHCDTSAQCTVQVGCGFPDRASVASAGFARAKGANNRLAGRSRSVVVVRFFQATQRRIVFGQPFFISAAAEKNRNRQLKQTNNCANMQNNTTKTIQTDTQTARDMQIGASQANYRTLLTNSTKSCSRFVFFFFSCSFVWPVQLNWANLDGRAWKFARQLLEN